MDRLRAPARPDPIQELQAGIAFWQTKLDVDWPADFHNADYKKWATATTSRRNSSGNAFGMINILPVRTNPHTSGVNQTDGSPNHNSMTSTSPTRRPGTDDGTVKLSV